jgi:hypothetical protein
MHIFFTSACGVLCLLAGAGFVSSGAGAQTIVQDHDLSLKSGETLSLGESYLISRDCKSLLKAPTEVEIMEGPPGVTVSMNEAMVTPYGHNCARPVKGAKVTLNAKDIEFYSHTTFVLRFKHITREGNQYYTHRYRLTVYP